MLRVPVLHKDGTPLMPCKPAKARKLLRDGKAEKHWTKEGVFYMSCALYSYHLLLIEALTSTTHTNRLTWDSTKHTQPMCLGIDPGAKFDGYEFTDAFGLRLY